MKNRGLEYIKVGTANAGCILSQWSSRGQSSRWVTMLGGHSPHHSGGARSEHTL